MTQLQALVERVETWPARSFATADAAVSDTIVYVADAAPFLNDEGTCTIDIDGIEYTATPDADSDTLTVSPALSVAVMDGDPIDLTPAAQVKWAWVSLPDDDSTDLTQCRVPESQVAYRSLRDGPRDPDARETVFVETDPHPTVIDRPNQVPTFDASTTPIVVSTDDGESVRLDGDGLTARTNDLVMWLRSFVGSGGQIYNSGAGDGFFVARDNGSNDIRKFDYRTGDEVTTNFPIVGTFRDVAAGDGTVAGIDNSSNDIKIYDGVTGSLLRTIVGTFGGGSTKGALALGGTNTYAINSVADIVAYDDTGSAFFTIAGTFVAVAYAGGNIYGLDNAGDIHKYDATTAVEDTSGSYPVAGSFASIAVDGDYIYAQDSGFVYRYLTADGTNDAAFLLGDFANGSYSNLAASGGYLFVADAFGNVRMYATGVTSEVSLQIESSTGRLFALQPVIYSSKARLTGSFATTSGVADQVSGWAGFDGTLANGNPFWRYTGVGFVIEMDGVYDLNALVKWEANATNLRVAYIRVNAAAVTQDERNASNSGSTGTSQSLAAIGIPLTAGDAIDLYVLQNRGGNLNVLSGSYLSITRRGSLAS